MKLGWLAAALAVACVNSAAERCRVLRGDLCPEGARVVDCAAAGTRCTNLDGSGETATREARVRDGAPLRIETSLAPQLVELHVSAEAIDPQRISLTVDGAAAQRVGEGRFRIQPRAGATLVIELAPGTASAWVRLGVFAIDPAATCEICGS